MNNSNLTDIVPSGQAAPSTVESETPSAPTGLQRVEGAPEAQIATPTRINFHAISAQEAESSFLLPPAQVRAIEMLTAGHAMVEAANAAGVNRTTLYRWLKKDPAFQAAYNAWQHDAIATARTRLVALADAAVSAIGKRIEKGDGRLGMRVLEKIGIADRLRSGMTDPQDVAREQTVERLNEQTRLQNAELDSWFDQSLANPPRVPKRG